MLRGIGPAFVAGVILILLVIGWLFLGQIGRARLQGHPRFQLALHDIDCSAPPGLSRTEFLDEVRYLARLPAQLDCLDSALPSRLRDAFGQHPWVAKVDEVTMAEQRTRIKLHFRSPVLAVPVRDGMRAVDGAGVLLPRSAPTKGLPIYDGSVEPPQNAAGLPWGDPALEKKARSLAKKNHEHTKE